MFLDGHSVLVLGFKLILKVVKKARTRGASPKSDGR